MYSRAMRSLQIKLIKRAIVSPDAIRSHNLPEFAMFYIGVGKISIFIDQPFGLVMDVESRRGRLSHHVRVHAAL